MAPILPVVSAACASSPLRPLWRQPFPVTTVSRYRILLCRRAPPLNTLPRLATDASSQCSGGCTLRRVLPRHDSRSETKAPLMPPLGRVCVKHGAAAASGGAAPAAVLSRVGRGRSSPTARLNESPRRGGSHSETETPHAGPSGRGERRRPLPGEGCSAANGWLLSTC